MSAFDPKRMQLLENQRRLSPQTLECADQAARTQ
jgi:hypothetical protein